MILIFAVSRDQAANAVIPWIERLGRSYIRINDDEPGSPSVRVHMDNDDLLFETGGRSYATADIEAIWFRKGSFWFPERAEAPLFAGQNELTRLVARKLKEEARIAGEYFHHLLRHKGMRVLGNPVLNDPNKLIVLHEARRLGLKVPDFEVVNRLGARHLANPSAYVTKALSDGVYLWDIDEAHRGYFTYTEDVGEVLASTGRDPQVPLSLIQQKIAKSLEIRSFYLDGRFASYAIYSQKDPQTAVDHRKYNAVNPNRTAPIDLPEEVKAKLRALFDRLELNTGSVDMIVDQDGELVFLEINPVGMYGGQTSVCNFNIDEAIARWLCGEQLDDWGFAPGADGRTDTLPPACV